MNTIEDLEKRVRTLESQLAFLRGATYVTTACVLAFLGYTIVSIPKQVSAKIDDKIGTDTEAHAKFINDAYGEILKDSDALVKKSLQDLPYEIVPVWRFFRHTGGLDSHIFVVDPGEVNRGGWDDQGIKFYALRKK
jgi:hypothetical protein